MPEVCKLRYVPSEVRVASAFKLVPSPVTTLLSALLLTVTPLAGNDSNVGSPPLFARKNLPSLEPSPCGSLASVTAWSAILSVVICESAI